MLTLLTKSMRLNTGDPEEVWQASQDGASPSKSDCPSPFKSGADSQNLDDFRDDPLSPHRRSKKANAADHEMICTAMKQDRVCALLSDEDIDAVLQTIEYFEFDPEENVVRQGDVGRTFFVVHTGTLKVEVNGQVVNTLTSGQTFGGLALLYKSPRTATVTAMEKTGCWGTNGNTFKQVLEENAKRQYAANRRFLDSVQVFDGLSSHEKDVVCSTLSVDTVQPGSRVVTEGEESAAIYFLKVGELIVLKGGAVTAAGTLEGSKEVGRINAGEWFGEISGEPHRNSVVASGELCQLLCARLGDLKEVMGDNLVHYLEHAFLLSGLRKSSDISQFSAQQQRAIAAAMSTMKYAAGAAIPSGLHFAIVVEGDVRTNDGDPIVRGQWYEELEQVVYDSVPVALPDEQPADRQTSPNWPRRFAGPAGCRLGVLSHADFTQVLKKLGLDGGGMEDSTRKMIVIRKVPAFLYLNEEQVAKLVNAFTLETFARGQKVFEQGERGSSFYVIASGEVRILIGGVLVRTMGSNAYFGERALLFDEPRTATVEVASAEAQIWSVDKVVFSQIVKGQMQQVLMERIRLQDTSVTLKDLQHMRVVGIGSAGVVRLVQHKQTGMRYALKRVRKKQGKIPSEVSRECRLLAENDHPMVMHLVKTFETAGSVYMLTELITGGELHAAIRRIPTVLSRLQAQFYAGCLVLVLEALADRNIVYRDLKPENVMLDSQGYLKLVDFGISKKLREGRPQTFTVIGTPHYMAPEILTGRGYGTEVDIWSLGVILFEFVCGFLPFADDLDDPTGVCQAVLRSRLKFPSRYRDAKGRECVEGMLCRQPKKRLGGGIRGYEALKSAPFFTAGYEKSQEQDVPGTGDQREGAGGESSLFSKLMSRELDPPLVPDPETYSEEVDGASLSDAHELG